VLANPLPLLLRPNSSASIQVVFSPTANVTYNGVIKIVVRYGEDESSSRVLPVSGTGTIAPVQPSAPAASVLLSLSTGNVNFGSVPVGTTSSQPVSLTNTGTGSVTILQATTTGNAFAVGGLSGSVTLAAGQSYSLVVSYTPTTAGNSTGAFSVVSDAANSPATATLTGVGVQPQIVILPASLSFPAVTVGAASSQTLVVSNPGNANLLLSQIAATGSGFSFSSISTPVNIAPGGSHSFTVTVSPAAAGTYSGSLNFSNNSTTPLVSVPFSGTAVASTLQLSASPTALSFGSVTTGSSATQTVTLTNTGNSSVSLSSYSVSGTGFSVSGLALPLVLSSGQATSFAVAFAPAATGSASGSVVVNSNATNSPATVQFSGSGTAPVIHGVALSWTPSSATYTGFNVYRGSASGGPYARINSSLLAAASFTDTGIASGQTYYYVATEVDASAVESAYSNEASAVIP